MVYTKVAVVGAGNVGKRVADYVSVQNDMELVGVADVVPSALLGAVAVKHQLYASTDSASGNLIDSGFNVVGNLDALLDQVNIVVDATPKGIPSSNMGTYSSHNVKVIVQGGEKHDLTNRSFNAFANYEDNLDAKITRVVSCNTTALCRMLSTLNDAYGVNYTIVDLVRRGSDPLNGAKGPANAIVPVLGESHHYADVATCIPGLEGKGQSAAIANPHTLSHVHMLKVELSAEVNTEEVLALLAATPRVNVIYGGKVGLVDTAKIAEFYKDIGRSRGDHPEVTIWGDATQNNGKYLTLIYDVHMESIPVPGTVDAIRALTGMERNPFQSIQKTDMALQKSGILPSYARENNLYVPVEQRLEIIRG